MEETPTTPAPPGLHFSHYMEETPPDTFTHAARGAFCFNTLKR
jgi:hypothetical protein